MTPRKVFLRGAAVLLAAALSLAASAQTAPTAKKSAPAKKAPAAAPAPLQLEPKALEILKAACDKLAASKTMSFTAVELFEQLSRQGAPLAYTTRYQVTLQRPDKLRVITPADTPAEEFFINGTTMMAYAPNENLLAKTDAPPSIEGALEKAYKSSGIYYPFTDIIVPNPYADLAKGLKHAYYVGQSKVIGNTTTDIVAFAGNGIFAEVWVGADDKLLRMIRAVYLDDPDHLRHEMAFSEWQLDQPVPADTFAPANAANAKPIPFAQPTPSAAPSEKPPVKAKPKQ